MIATPLSRVLWVGLVVVVLQLSQSVNAQENVQTRVPNSLTECYTNAAIVNRDSRLPSNMNILIELIRKIEDWPGLNMDMRQLASTLVHRFRMDGIERAAGTFEANVLPFSPSGFQFTKHRLLLSRLIPGSAQFPNDSLTPQERCALHFMLSTSIERTARNDEANVCNQLSQLRSMRIPRSVPQKENFIGDVELLQARNTHKRPGQTGRYMAAQEDGEEAVDTELELEHRGEEAPELGFGELPIDVPDELDADSLHNVEVISATQTQSQCPVENGVIRTMWGAVSGGPLITGIAAGLEPQTVQIRDLLALSRSASQFSSRQTAQVRVDNRWAATLSGDLSEVTLLQGPMSPTILVGGIGGWNSTTIPRWYFLSQRDRLEMTDAEIRGGLDGLILAMNMDTIRNQAPQIRLSQLLDMYYSQRGIFSTNLASCNRRTLFTQVAPIETIRAQTAAFSTVLDREMQMRVTLPAQSITQFADRSAATLSTYIPQSLNDPTCATTTIVPRDVTIWRSAVDLLIYIDVTWTFREIQPVVAHLVESLDVNRFGTTITLFSGNNAQLLVNTTNSLSEFYINWNNTNHQQHPNGLVLPNVLRSVRARARDIQAEEQRTNNMGGRSLISVIIPQLATISEADNAFSIQEMALLNDEAPDMLLLFLAGGTLERFTRFVREPSRDMYPLQVTGANTDNVPVIVNPLVQRIQTVPRRIINPQCGNNWTTPELSGHTQNHYVERGSVNFYRLAPNYFFEHAENRRIRVQGHGYAPITVCTSRFVDNPRPGASTPDNDINCVQLLSDTHDIPIVNFCDGGIIHRCLPLFISVSENSTAAASAPFRCSDPECRFPDNIRFSITSENLGCFSGVASVAASMGLVFALFALLTARF